MQPRQKRPRAPSHRQQLLPSASAPISSRFCLQEWHEEGTRGGQPPRDAASAPGSDEPGGEEEKKSERNERASL